ncbi:MAG: endonuclease domain-containing protein [Breznakibacter sp.]
MTDTPQKKDVSETRSMQCDSGDGQNTPCYITANPLSYGLIKDYREQLKYNPTEAERVMWEYLRGKKIGHKIRRQHVINDFIVDFVCLNKRLIIEIDGKIHDYQADKDAARTFILNSKGYEVIRFTNDEVLANPQTVSEKIRTLLDTRENCEK